MKRSKAWDEDKKVDQSKNSPSDENILETTPKSRFGLSVFIDYLKEYTSKTSLHGIQYVGEDNRTVSERMWWVIMVLSSFMTCTFLIQKIYTKWDESPVIVSFSEHSTPIWQIPFPAVTICPAMQVNRSLYDFSENFFKKENLSDDELFTLNSVALLCHGEMGTGYKYINESAIAEIIKISPLINQSSDRCIWKKKAKPCDVHFIPVLTEYGLCYSTNTLDAKDIYRENVVNIKYATNGIKNDGWSLDKGYGHVRLKTYPLRALSTGLKTGLEIHLSQRTENNEYWCSGMVDGFKISLHLPNVIPRTADNFFWAPMDMTTVVNIKPNVITTSDGLKNYDPLRRKCFFSTEKSLSFFKEYTQENCELECLANFTLAMCGCVTFAMPRFEGTPICGDESRVCAQNASDDIFMQTIRAQLPKTLRPIEKKISKSVRRAAKACNCLPTCSSITYEPEISLNKLKWETYMKSIHPGLDMNVLSGLSQGRLKIYFKESQFITSKRSELYGLVDFLSNCGGLLGLCLGFSMLSLIEIIYFATLRLFSHIKQLSKEKPEAK